MAKDEIEFEIPEGDYAGIAEENGHVVTGIVKAKDGQLERTSGVRELLDQDRAQQIERAKQNEQQQQQQPAQPDNEQTKDDELEH